MELYKIMKNLVSVYNFLHSKNTWCKEQRFDRIIIAKMCYGATVPVLAECMVYFWCAFLDRRRRWKGTAQVGLDEVRLARSRCAGSCRRSCCSSAQLPRIRLSACVYRSESRPFVYVAEHAADTPRRKMMFRRVVASVRSFVSCSENPAGSNSDRSIRAIDHACCCQTVI